MSRLRLWLRETLARHDALVPLRRLRLGREARARHADWAPLIGGDQAAWQAALARAAGGPRILLPTSVGLHFAANALESLLAVALTLRGCRVETLLCDAALPACMACQIDWFPKPEDFPAEGPQRRLCGACHAPAAAMWEGLGIKVNRYGDWLTPADAAEAEALARGWAERPDRLAEAMDGGIRIGEQSLAGALRFVARGELAEGPLERRILERYLAAGVLTARAAHRLFRAADWRRAVFHHGIYVPQGLIAEAARTAGVALVNWVPSYRAGTFIFSHGDTYHRELMTEPCAGWEAMPWGPAREKALLDYLESRGAGTGDWISFHDHREADAARIFAAAGLDPAKPTIGLLTNVAWDAQIHYPQNAFPTMLDWVMRTVTWFAGRPDLQLLIRVHPAELSGNVVSRQRVADELARRFPALPANVGVVGPESPVSTYAAMRLCDSVLIYATKTGLELAAAGIPVIVAGEAWSRGKGFTQDVRSAAEYEAMLAALPLGRRLPPDQVARARRYAYHFFFRRMIPLGLTRPRAGFPPFDIAFEGGLDALRPGRSPGLDTVCDAIIHGAPFVFDPPLEDEVCRQPDMIDANVMGGGA